VITKVVHGRQAGGLIAYLMGPGRAQEHVRLRVIASGDGRDARWRPHASGPSPYDLDLGPLIRAVRAPAVAAGLPKGDPCSYGGAHRGPLTQAASSAGLVMRRGSRLAPARAGSARARGRCPAELRAGTSSSVERQGVSTCRKHWATSVRSLDGTRGIADYGSLTIRDPYKGGPCGLNVEQ
jgi:hypothetical protein